MTVGRYCTALGSALLSVSICAQAHSGTLSNWSGFYAGLGVGYGGFSLDERDLDPSASPPLVMKIDSSTNAGGALATVIGGYDRQVSDKIVLGAFADFDLSAATFHFFNPGIDVHVRETSQWSLGARAGYLAEPDTLWFLSTGYTRAHFRQETNPVQPPFIQLGPFDSSGWFVGAGTESQLGDGLALRVEYRYAMMGAETSFKNLLNGISATSRPAVQTGRVVLSYKVGDDDPPAANEPAAARSIDNLTGPYLGVGAGYGQSFGKLFSAIPFGSQTADSSIGGRGGLGTLLAGDDWKLGSNALIGAFADVDFGDISYSQSPPSFPEGFASIKQNQTWAIGARGGVDVGEATLLFVSAGYTGAHFSAHIIPAVPGETANFGTFGGWFVGVGAETAIADDWSLRLEYRYSDYGSRRVFSAPFPGGGTAFDNFTPRTQTGRIAVVYHPDFI